MPIEFYCPGCGNLMRTPDETAGRKGRCPTCQLKVQIPASSVASTSPEAAVPRTAKAASPKEKAPQPIRFDCGSCGKTLSIAATNAGKKGKCPHCGGLMSIPLKSTDAGERWKGTPKQRSTPSPAPSSTTAPTQQPSALVKAGGEKIEFHCSNCHEVVRVGRTAAGKKGQCPRCKAVIQIPLNSTSASALQPVSRNKPKPTSPRPQGKPAGSIPGLTTLPSNSPAPAGLTPLEDLDVLSPLEPLGLTPLGAAGSKAAGSDPFGGDLLGPGQIGAGNPFAADLTPYAAPASAPAIPRRPRQGARSGAEIATMICGGCLVFYSGAQIVLVSLSMLLQGFATYSLMGQLRGQGEDQAVFVGLTAVRILLLVLGGIVMLTILAGGIQMIRLKVWGLCLAACILAMLPCNCFCILGLPIGIWGIVMLSLGKVRSAFR